ncbi:hypothetical protein HK104_003538 [Borealophlyctis nickersoniae]|nr:hypothetical protein HK104_003538 [Borealophlyctis nickersoniae]
MVEEQQLPRPEILLRRGSVSRGSLKEKVVVLYEAFFKGDDPSALSPDTFWDEFFLLKVNASCLGGSIAAVSNEQLLALKDNINQIIVHAIDAMEDRYYRRQINAMETLCVMLSHIFAKKFNNFSFDVINLVTGLEHADVVFKKLVSNLEQLLVCGETLEVRGAALKLCKIIVTGSDNINQNSLNEYFMLQDIHASLLKIIGDSAMDALAYDALMLLSLLCNYNKYERPNPYIGGICKLSDRDLMRWRSFMPIQVVSEAL